MKPAGRRRFALVGAEQAVGMGPLQIALDALGTEHAAVEGELLPRLEADDLIVLDLELNAALLAAEAAMRLAPACPARRRLRLRADGVRQVRAELVDEVQAVVGVAAMVISP